MPIKLIKVKVRDASSILFEGEADRISSFNEVGVFDIYPMHANFISIIKDKLTIFLHNAVLKEFKIERAIMKVKQDSAQIYLGIEAFVLEADILDTKKSVT